MKISPSKGAHRALISHEPNEGAGCAATVRRIGRYAADWMAGRLGQLMGRRAGNAFGILTYHRITPCPGGTSFPTQNVTPERVRTQMAGLLADNFRPCSLREVLARSRHGPPLPPRTFVVTVDDGFENVYEYAWPIFRELGIPATVFLATAYLDTTEPFPFDDWSAAGSPLVPAVSWRPLTTAQCAQMLAGGLVDLGSHTHTHDVFRDRPEALRQDVLESLTVLQQRFALTGIPFSFPFGIAEPALIAAVRGTGVLCSLTTKTSMVAPGSDPFGWGRFRVTQADTARSLAGKLDGWYDLCRSAYHCLTSPLAFSTTDPKTCSGLQTGEAGL